MYDLLIYTNCQLFEEDGGSMGGTERQIYSVAESLAAEGLDVGLVHSETDGTDKIINGVKHLNKYRHYYDYSKVRLMVNHFGYYGNFHRGENFFNPHVPALSPIEINCAEKTFLWFHNWFHLNSDDYPRIFNSKSIQNYAYHSNPTGRKVKILPEDRVIYYMVPKGLSQKPVKKRQDYLFWMSAFGKGLKEAVLTYISMYERGMTRPLRISVPPQRFKKDVKIVETLLKDVNKNNYPIQFLGELPYNQALYQLANSACLFRPALPQETFGLVYLEANQLGVPVLTFAGDAGEEILHDKNNLLLDKHHKLQDIIDWLKDIDTKTTSVDMSKFDPDKITKEWINLIEKA